MDRDPIAEYEDDKREQAMHDEARRDRLDDYTPHCAPAPYEPTDCPHCEGFTSNTRDEERAHVTTAHPELVEQRLVGAGFRRIDGEWVDTLADPHS